MEIVIKGADFSNLGLGNSRWIENYIIKSGITNLTQISALRTLYNGMISTGIGAKFDKFYIFFSANKDIDSFDLLSQDKDLTFVNDNISFHTSNGFSSSNSIPSYAISEGKITDITNVHFHTWNTTPITSQSGALKLSLGVLGTLDSNNFYFQLGRNLNTGQAGMLIGSQSSNDVIVNSAATTNLGLLSGVKNNLILNLYDNGEKLATSNVQNANNAIFSNKSSNSLRMHISSLLGYPAFGATIKTFFTGWGQYEWTDDDEINLKNLLTSFRTELNL